MKTREYFTAGMGESNVRIYSEKRFIKTTQPGFNEEYFEWIDLLEAVVSASNQFTMIELGAGFGRWLVNAAAALGLVKGPSYLLIGVEAEPTHFKWMQKHIQDNTIKETDCKLINAAVSDTDGFVKFYVGKPSECYGQHIVHSHARSLLHRILKRIKPVALKKILDLKTRAPATELEIKEVRSLSLNTLLQPLTFIDLMDLDVGGSELVILESAEGQLNEKVKRIHIETHSTGIESGLRRLFKRLGWRNIFDYPCMSKSPTPWGIIEFQGGVQSWINLLKNSEKERLKEKAPRKGS